MRNTCLAMFFLLLVPSASADDAMGCASTIRELRILLGDPFFPYRWEESSMDDGKPLRVSIIEGNGMLLLEFIKTGEGMWAKISGLICKVGSDLEIRLSKEQVTLGTSANWMLRLALANGGVFTLRRRLANELQIKASGWNGSFVPSQGN